MPLLERIQTPIGASGSDLIANQVWRSDEYNVDLNSPQSAVAVYDMMRKSDAQVRASINNLLYTLLSLEWRIDPAKDDPEGEMIAEHVRSVLMPGETYGYSGASSWIDTLRGALSAVWAGFSVMEKVKGFRPRDAKQVIAAFEQRLPKSIQHWTVAKTGLSRLESVTQLVSGRDGTYDTRVLPADRCVVLTFNREGDNYWGESILRPAHYYWRRKRDLLKLDAIQKERMGGIFWVTSKDGKTPTPEQIAKAKLVLQNFRIHEKQGLYFPDVFEFHALFPGGEGGKFIESVEYDDRMIERAMFSSFQSLGTGDRGALSVGEIQLDFMLLAYQAVVKWVEDGFGKQVIEDEVNTNFEEREFYPRLAGESLLQMKPDRLATALAPLIEKGAVRIDRPLRVYFRSKFALPEEDEATLEPVPGIPAPAVPAPEAGDRPEPKAEPTQKLRKATGRSGVSLDRSGDPYFWRDALPHEGHVGFEDMKRFLDQAPILIWHRKVGPIRDEQIKALAAAVSRASEAQLGQGQITAPLRAELAEAIFSGLIASYREGRRSVLADAARQRLGKAIRPSEQDDEEDDPEIEPTKKQSTWILRIAQALAFTMTGKLVSEAITAGQLAQDQGRDATEIEAAVRTALSPTPVGNLSEAVVMAELAGKVVQAFTTGRVEQGQSMAGEITAVYYSARMDTGTCDPCWAMDGQELDLEDWASQVPNPNCDWSAACRCEPVFIFAEQARAA